jgi:hypothetical protein
MKKIQLMVVVSSLILLLGGCGNNQPSLGDAVKNSYKVTKGMTKDRVSQILKQDPTSVQRIDDFEIWKFEGIETNEDTEESKYVNLIIKFKNGKVSNIGTFSCKVPKTTED